jgi:hypothetical protein
VYISATTYVCKEWAKIHPFLALCSPESIVLPLLVYPSVSPTLLMERAALVMGAPW